MGRSTSNSPRKPLTNLPQPNLTGTRPLSPLQYMLNIVNDATASASRRDRMAVVAARYMHPRPSSVRKKRQQAEAAEKAGGGVWAGDLDYIGHRPQ
jgi:hypothetical protein